MERSFINYEIVSIAVIDRPLNSANVREKRNLATEVWQATRGILMSSSGGTSTVSLRAVALLGDGLTQADRDVNGVVEMMLDATRKYAEQPTARRLLGWDAALFATGRSGMPKIRVGSWRDDGKGACRLFRGRSASSTSVTRDLRPSVCATK